MNAKTWTLLLTASLSSPAGALDAQRPPDFEGGLPGLAAIMRTSPPAPVRGAAIAPPGAPAPRPGGAGFHIITDASPLTPTYQIAPQRERELLGAALEDAYPQLPGALQDFARRVTIRIAHGPTRMTERYSGWGPEDDPDYVYPDRELYPAGTVKLNFSKRFMVALELGSRLGAEDPAVREGLRGYSRNLIAHELTHGMQYHTAPVRDLEHTYPRSFPDGDGLADEAVLAENERKIQYERDAYAADWPFVHAARGGMHAFADAIDRFKERNPALFGPEGRYRLLVQANDFAQYYLRDDSDRPTPEFSRDEAINYLGQVRPPRIVLELVALNRELESPGLAGPELESAKSKVRRWQAEWPDYAGSRDVQALPYWNQVSARYGREVERFWRLADAPSRGPG